ncbi:MAG: flagellar basal body-associated FliL family protein [Halopseudomonas yangmingensis]|uniref:Flagellar protein FliL n=1 Tax=Halopseudomonas yangmingensis TaxID=1720063 RepID=A0A1I4RYH5_9GAMM|nr:flagellar basal body-associated FliL family protein [Halopseudomonas yangmingensis]SFM57267.1 flagellar FliL protein [Halopseudomonas yangmingensis]
MRLITVLLLGSLLSTPALAQTAPQYHELSPAFVGVLAGSGARIQYLKADVALRINDPAALARVQYHDPLIRNELVSLFGQQTRETLDSLEGKEALRATALERVRAVLESEEGQPLVDDLLFTNLITQ